MQDFCADWGMIYTYIYRWWNEEYVDRIEWSLQVDKKFRLKYFKVDGIEWICAAYFVEWIDSLGGAFT